MWRGLLGTFLSLLSRVHILRSLDAFVRSPGDQLELWSAHSTACPVLMMRGRHANRTVVQTPDVLLLARRNEDLEGVLRGEAERFRRDRGGGGATRGRGRGR